MANLFCFFSFLFSLFFLIVPDLPLLFLPLLSPPTSSPHSLCCRSPSSAWMMVYCTIYSGKWTIEIFWDVQGKICVFEERRKKKHCNCNSNERSNTLNNCQKYLVERCEFRQLSHLFSYLELCLCLFNYKFVNM